MNGTFKNILVILISSGVFTILFNHLYKSNPDVLSFIQKIPEKYKGKWHIRWIVLLILMFLISILVVVGGLSNTIGTIMVGFFIALTDLIFIRKNIS